jgi:O-antigen ligase
VGAMKTVILLLAALGLTMTQVLVGGWAPVFSLPGYAILVVAALLSWWRNLRVPISGRATDGLAAAALLFLYIAGRALFSPEEYLARNDLYMALAGMVMYLLVALNLTSSKSRGLFVGFLLVLGVANCLIGAIQFTKGTEFMISSFLTRGPYGTRASGFYGYPNHLALFLEVCVFMGLSVAFWSRWRPWVKLLAGYSALVCVLGLLLTGSRGGYLGGIAGLIVFGLLSLRLVGDFFRNRALALLVAGVVLFGGLAFGVQHFFSKSSTLQARVAQSITGDDTRLQIWKTGWRQFKLQPIVGTGSGTFRYYARQFSPQTLTSDPLHAHNEYIEVLAEYGILGIAIALMCIDTHLRSGWRLISRELAQRSEAYSTGGNSLALTIGAMSSVAACLFHSGLDFTLHMPANLLTMAFVFGLLANPRGTHEEAGELAPSAETSGSNLSPYIRLALPALGLWLAIKALPTWPAEFFAHKARYILADWKYMESGERARELAGIAERGLQLDPRNPQLHRISGIAENALATQATEPAVKAEQAGKAIASYEKAMSLAPRDVHLVLDLAWAYEAQQQPARAEPLFKRAIELDPTSSNAHYGLAWHLHAQGSLKDAAEEYKTSYNLGGGQSAQMGLDRIAAEMKEKQQGKPPPPER